MQITQILTSIGKCQLYLLLILCLSACPDDEGSEQANSEIAAEIEAQRLKDTVLDNTAADKLTEINNMPVKSSANSPQIDSSEAQQSKPLHEFSGNSAEQKHDTLYEVPNHIQPPQDPEKVKKDQDERNGQEKQN